MDTQIVRPIAGVTDIYTVIVRFDSPEQMDRWLASSTRKRLIEKIQPSLVDGDRYATRSGLEFLFAGTDPTTSSPVRWKQWLVTGSVIYPLVLLVPYALASLGARLGLPDNRYLLALLSTAIIVGLMVYVIMPRYTHLVRRWLFR